MEKNGIKTSNDKRLYGINEIAIGSIIYFNNLLINGKKENNISLKLVSTVINGYKDVFNITVENIDTLTKLKGIRFDYMNIGSDFKFNKKGYYYNDDKKRFEYPFKNKYFNNY